MVAGPLHVNVDQACRVGTGDDVLDVSGPLGAQLRGWLAQQQATTDGAFTLAEFTGGQGSWTVPHIHREMEESFFVLAGEFTFAVGEQEIAAGPGAYILVPRGTRHDSIPA